jgi:hypothetical protein
LASFSLAAAVVVDVGAVEVVVLDRVVAAVG